MRRNAYEEPICVTATEVTLAMAEAREMRVNLTGGVYAGVIEAADGKWTCGIFTDQGNDTVCHIEAASEEAVTALLAELHIEGQNDG
jgi:hypothetical protein